MAIGTPTERYAVHRTVQGASTTLSPASQIAAGTLAIMCVTCSTNTKVVSSVTDNVGGNTWVVDKTYTGPLSTLNVSFVSCQVTNAIGTGAVITINYSLSTNNAVSIWIEEVTGLAASSAFDKFATGDGVTVVAGTPLTSGNTATLSQAAEIVFFGVRASDLTGWTKGSGYSDATTPILGSTVSALEYKIVAATTAVAGSATHSNSTDYTGLLVTYKGAAGVAPANTVAPAVTGTPTVGSVLSCTTGTWTDDGSPTFTYQWQRDVLGNSSYSNIAAATASTYTLTLLDDSCNVRCVVTDTDSNGATAANSNGVLDLTDIIVPALNPAQHGRAVLRAALR